MVYLLAAAMVGVSAAVTFFMIGYARSHGLVDVPNERSSHTVRTPRGGGVSIVLTFLFGSLLALGWSPLLGFFLAGAALVAVVGWMDDRRGVPALTRLSVHLAGAAIWAWGLYSIQGDTFFGLPPALWLGGVILFTGWLVNLYNFMDGSDGIAAIEALTVSWVSALIVASNGSSVLFSLYLWIGAASLGFLVFNWSPAKIFMGDVASGFLGFVFGALAIWGQATGAISLVSSVILLGVFIADASYTLCVRAFQGQRLSVAHRDHTYQHAIQRGMSHSRVATVVALINLFWLAPWAWFANARPNWSIQCLIMAYLPLFAIAGGFKAGIKPSGTDLQALR